MANERIKQIFAENLRRLLEENRMQDKDLIPVTGASQTAISDWLNAKKYPRMDKIEKIANHFQIQKSDLIEEKMTPTIPIAVPKTVEAQIVSAGMDDLTQDDREVLLSVFLSMMRKRHPERFEKGDKYGS